MTFWTVGPFGRHRSLTAELGLLSPVQGGCWVGGRPNGTGAAAVGGRTAAGGRPENRTAGGAREREREPGGEKEKREMGLYTRSNNLIHQNPL